MFDRCPVCNSPRLLRGLEQKATFRWPTVVVSPGGAMGTPVGDVRGVACVDCGAVQWFARDRERLAQLYEEQQALSLKIE